MPSSYGNLCVVNKDGSFGSSVEIKKAMTIGNSNPANIRIKSKCISAQHARVEVDENGDCFIVPLTDKHEPKINSIKIKTRSMLANHDRISVGGRVFIFNKPSHVTPCCTDVASVTATVKGVQKQDIMKPFGQLVLVAMNGSPMGTAVKIRKEVIVGRELPSTFRIKSPHVSKQHLKIVVDENDQCVLTHISTTNPPVINGVEVTVAILKDGDKICIGDVMLQYTSACDLSPCHSKKTASEVDKENICSKGNKNCCNMAKSISHKTNTTGDAVRPSSILAADGGEKTCLGHSLQSIKALARKPCDDSEDTVPNRHAENFSNGVSINEMKFLSSSITVEDKSRTPSKASLKACNYPAPSPQALRAMRSDTRALLPNGRPSLETMMAQWEFMRDQFLGSSDEALEWLMLSKSGGVEAYKHAKRKAELAEDQYYKSLFEIDLLENKKRLINQELAPVLKDLCGGINIKENSCLLQTLFTKKLKGICSKQLSICIGDFLQQPDNLTLLDASVDAYKDEMKILSERLRSSVVASEESLGEMEQWSEREKNTTAYKDAQAEDDKQWVEAQREANGRALAQMRELIPVNICQISMSQLGSLLEEKRGFYSHALCSEIKKNKLLHLVVMHPDDIAQLNFLMGESRQYFLDLDLDVIEMRAIRACLPDAFCLDKDGQKAAWREKFITKLKLLVSRESGDMVKGGWDADAGRRVMVRLPALHTAEQRRSVYFYETPLQLNQKLQRCDKQQALLSTKKQLLADIEQRHAEFKVEYDTVLAESRNPAYQQQYGMEVLTLAKEAAKQDYRASDERRKTVQADISRLEATILAAPVTKDDLLVYFKQHVDAVQDWELSKGRILIPGVFESNPVISRVAKASAVFATPEEEASSRKSELMSLQNRATTSAATSDSDNEDRSSEVVSTRRASQAHSVNKLHHLNSTTIQTLNSICRKEAVRRSNSAPTNVSKDDKPLTLRPIKSKNLQKILNDCQLGGTASQQGSVLPPPPPRPPPPQLSFLDQLKNRKK